MGYRKTKRRRIQAQWKTLVESWKFQCRGEPAAVLENARLKMFALLMPTNPWDPDWKMYRNGVMNIYHCRRGEFIASLQSCAQIHSDTSSIIKSTGCKKQQWKRMGKLEKHQLEHGWGMFQIGNVYSLNEKKTSCPYQCTWTISNGWQNTKTLSRLGQFSSKTLIGRTNIISWPCLSGCTERECEISKDIVDNYRSMFKSRIWTEAVGKQPGTKATEKPDAETIFSWSFDMEGHTKKCVGKYCELANKNDPTII